MQNSELQLTTFREQRKYAAECLNKGHEMLAEGWLALYVIKAEKSYEAEFETWEEFVSDFTHDVPDTSRTLVYDMVRMVRRLKALEWPDDEILKALKSPTVAQEALLEFGEWERGGGLLKLSNGVERPEDADDVEVISEMVKTAIDLPRGEGRKYVSETTREPQVYATLKEADDFTLIVIVDDDTNERFEFFCRELVSNGARNFLEKKLGTRFAE